MLGSEFGFQGSGLGVKDFAFSFRVLCPAFMFTLGKGFGLG